MLDNISKFEQNFYQNTNNKYLLSRTKPFLYLQKYKRTWQFLSIVTVQILVSSLLFLVYRARIRKLLSSPGIGFQVKLTNSGSGIRNRLQNLEQSMGDRNRVGIGLSYRHTSAGIFKQSMGARNQVGIGFSYRPARLHSLAELVPWN
jgi:hypothetical protein